MRFSLGKEAAYLLIAVLASVAALVLVADVGFVFDERLHTIAAGVGSPWVLTRLGMVLKALARLLPATDKGILLGRGFQ